MRVLQQPAVPTRPNEHGLDLTGPMGCTPPQRPTAAKLCVNHATAGQQPVAVPGGRPRSRSLFRLQSLVHRRWIALRCAGAHSKHGRRMDCCSCCWRFLHVLTIDGSIWELELSTSSCRRLVLVCLLQCQSLSFQFLLRLGLGILSSDRLTTAEAAAVSGMAAACSTASSPQQRVR